jgi:hypothetical protein
VHIDPERLVAGFARRLSLYVLLASGVGCATGLPPPGVPATFSFRPTDPGSALWLATPIAVEVVTEREARDLESVDPMYVGELGVRGGPCHASEVALMAAEKGATHFRIVTAGDASRIDVVLFRVAPARWSALPASLRPAAPAGPVSAGEPHAAL